MKNSLAILFCLLFSLNVSAHSQFPNIKFLADGAKSPNADLSAVSWLAGHWRGQAFGGEIEEIWAPAHGGSMMGAFKLVVGGKVNFYEIETISQENDSLVFRLRHFSPDLKAWEEKDETLDFHLVKVTKNKVFFNGMTLERVSDKQINIYVAIEDKGTTTEQKFSYTRVK